MTQSSEELGSLQAFEAGLPGTGRPEILALYTQRLQEHRIDLASGMGISLAELHQMENPGAIEGPDSPFAQTA